MIYDDINVMEERHAPYPFLHLTRPSPPPSRKYSEGVANDSQNGIELVVRYIFNHNSSSITTVV